ncbi:MAG: hypothetical protein KGO50_00875 [Myxococcales bacterium]|nr:hypothetical protein [Myxococcales bacterium]
MRSLATTLVVAFALVACSPDNAATDLTSSPQAQSLALDPDERVVWVASADDDSIAAHDAQTLELLGLVQGIDAPSRVAWTEFGIVVIGSRSSVVTLIDPLNPRAARIQQTWEIPCRGADQLTILGDQAWIGCGDDLRLVGLDLRSGEVGAVVGVERRIEALATSGGTLWVSRGGELVGVAERALADAGPEAVLAQFQMTRAAFDSDGRVANRAGILLLDGQRTPTAIVQRVEADVDRGRSAESGDYGRVHDGNPRLQPWFVGSCSGGYAVYDGGDRVLAGAHSAARSGNRVWVTHRFTQNVALLGCPDEGAPSEPVQWLGTARVGAGAAGVVTSSDGMRAWVDVAFEGAVARLDITDDGMTQATGRRPIRALRFSEAALEGRRLFHDATRPQLTPAGVVACASCHEDGGDDGIGWFIHTTAIEPKFRRTTPVWTAALGAPLHWDGEFLDSDVLVSSAIVGLMSGTGRLVDLTSISAYMRELPAPEPPPAANPAEAACRERGRVVFAEAQCATCHAGAAGTDAQSHIIRSAPSDLAGIVGAVRTPALIGVRARGPWLHDASAATLSDIWRVLDPNGEHGLGAGLDDDSLDDLICYVESL